MLEVVRAWQDEGVGTSLLLSLLGGGLLVAVAVGRLVEQREGDRIWGEVARRLGLRHEGGIWPVSNRRLDGAFEELTVEIREVRRGREYVPRVSVRGPGIDPRLELSEEGLTRQLERLLGGGDIETGDEAFDRALNVQGDAAAALAALAEEQRAELLEIARHFHLELSARRLTVTLPRPIDGPDELVRCTYSLVSLARALALPKEGVAEALARGAATDSNPRVRRRLVEMLNERFPTHAATLGALAAALRDPDDQVRTFAMLHGQSAEATAALAERAVDRRETPQRRMDALRALVGRQGEKVALSGVLSSLLECSEVPLQVEAAAIVGAERLGQHFEALRNLALYASPEAQRAAALALGILGEARAESTLLGLLLRDDAGVQEAAARALGETGTLRAVQPLRYLLAGTLSRFMVRDAAQVAIARIQQRSGCAEAGSLALADAEVEAGAVSVSSEGGAVSLAPLGGELGISRAGGAAHDAAAVGAPGGHAGLGDTLVDALPFDAQAPVDAPAHDAERAPRADAPRAPSTTVEEA